MDLSIEQRLELARSVLGVTTETVPAEVKERSPKSQRTKRVKPLAPPKTLHQKVYSPRRSFLETENMGIIDLQVTNPSFQIISQINKQYIKDAKLQTLSDSQRSSIRDLILRSMGFTSRPSQEAPISEGALAAHHRKMQDDLSYMSQDSRLGLISPLLDYLLEDASRFTPQTLETLKVMRDFLLEKNTRLSGS